MERFPALAESRRRLLSALERPEPGLAELLPVVESDLGLAIAVLRAANRPGRFRREVSTLRAALEKLSADHLETLAADTQAVDFFQRDATWDLSAQRFRVHAVATQRAADRIAQEVGDLDREQLATAALLHDIGKLVLRHAYPAYPERVHGDARTPEARLAAERRVLGLDHGLVGGVLARRWGLPDRLSALIEHHHDPEAEGEVAILRLADMLAHYGSGSPVEPRALLALARAVGLEAPSLRAVLFEVPFRSEGPRLVEPSPLTSRELDVIRVLARGKKYREIADELGVSESTVRTHLQGAYKKLGVADRAQVVLVATEYGWI
jgi:putative nucleotidyltransferase with HDIG domain